MEKLTHNWHLKLMSLFISFLVWMLIVNYEDPLIRKSFENVPVSKQNEYIITSQDLAVEYVDGETVDLVLRGKRSIMDRLQANDIMATADMSRVSITNAVDIDIDAGDEVEILDMTPNKLVISTEKIISQRRSVQVFYEGELEENYVQLDAEITPNQIELTGPESKLATVSSVTVPINVQDANDDVTLFVSPQIRDADGNEVRDVTVSNNQIQIKVPIQKIKTIPVVVQSYGEIRDDLRLISIGSDVKNVTVRGEDLDVNAITRLTVNDLDRSTFGTDTSSIQVNLADYLPEGISLYEVSGLARIEVVIEPIVSATLSVNQGDVTVRHLPDGLQFKFVDETPYEVTINGIYEGLQALTVDNLVPTINLSDLTAGEHEVALQLYVPSGFELTSEAPLVKVQLVEAPVLLPPDQTTEEDGQEEIPPTTTRADN